MDIISQSLPRGCPPTQQHPSSDCLSTTSSNVKKTKKPTKKSKAVSKPSEAVSKPSKSRSKETLKKGPPLERPDYLNIIAYLSEPSKYNTLFGGGKKTLVTGQSMNITNSWSLFSAYIQELYNQRHPNKPIKLTGCNLQQGFVRYRQQYVAAKHFPNSTGSGTSHEDERRGIYTYEQKLESLCPCYSEMDNLFGEKANVTAMAEWDSLILSDSEDDYDDNIKEEEEEQEQDPQEFMKSDHDSDIEFQSGQFIAPKSILGRSPKQTSRSHTLPHIMLEDDEDDITSDLESLTGTNGIF